jgi:hypothetical protein
MKVAGNEVAVIEETPDVRRSLRCVKVGNKIWVVATQMAN